MVLGGRHVVGRGLSSGCTATTGGNAGPAPNIAPHALTGPVIKHAMIDGTALAMLLNQPFQTAYRPCPPTA
ncbi:hypothetical protein C3469_22940 [Mycobacterium kansasii]|nr:hypothetical protein C3B43_23155 [Mycobacterium kansasii]POX98150.1 hypothetical protein C3479_23455 [Mycobacterium kansasii]POY03176.1 hypothetical protein C3477_17090 [Mycobacterium kansasii]POY15418.1 hypothetical protein C3476_24840 [Mycobacterium kansasii]POY23065.1 hypothetical protein C3469_22940 [Mycobacterium kansasii]